MRPALLALILVLCAGTASAQDYTTSEYCAPWCTLGARSGATDCSFYTFEQCRIAGSGTAHTCVQNPFLSYCTRGRSAPSPSPRRRRND